MAYMYRETILFPLFLPVSLLKFPDAWEIFMSLSGHHNLMKIPVIIL